MATTTGTPEVPVDSITVGKRVREDMGDLDALANSIKELGLLHPIVINQNDALIAGARRLAAVKRLGWTKVPVTIVPLDRLVRGEYAENEFRKQWTPSEQVAIKKALDADERAAAKQRQARPGQARSAKFAGQAETGRSRQKVAEAAGSSHETLRKAEAVVDAADVDPEKFGPIVEEMDRTGKVDPAYRAVQSTVEPDTAPATTPSATSTPSPPPPENIVLPLVEELRQVIDTSRDRWTKAKQVPLKSTMQSATAAIRTRDAFVEWLLGELARLVASRRRSKTGLRHQPTRNYQSNDCVMTPLPLAQALVAALQPSGVILEPCAGTGNFVEALKPYGEVHWCEIDRGRDFFDWTEPVDEIVTNGPWSLFSEVLAHALPLARRRVALVCSINHVFTRHRARLVENAGFGLERIIKFDAPREWQAPGFELGLVVFTRGYEGSHCVIERLKIPRSSEVVSGP